MIHGSHKMSYTCTRRYYGFTIPTFGCLGLPNSGTTIPGSHSNQLPPTLVALKSEIFRSSSVGIWKSAASNSELSALVYSEYYQFVTQQIKAFPRKKLNYESMQMESGMTPKMTLRQGKSIMYWCIDYNSPRHHICSFSSMKYFFIQLWTNFFQIAPNAPKLVGVLWGTSKSKRTGCTQKCMLMYVKVHSVCWGMLRSSQQCILCTLRNVCLSLPDTLYICPGMHRVTPGE